MKNYIPNIFTSLNLLSGCIGVVMAFNNNITGVVVCVIVASMFDFIDGFVARLLNAHSFIGKELDSLADLISFGLVPGVMIYMYLINNLVEYSPIVTIYRIIPYAAFIITIFSALRLAKFNIDTRQTNAFIGLPTPACALFWISIIYTLNKSEVILVKEHINIVCYIVILTVFIFSYLLVCNINMFSLKIKNSNIRENKYVAILIVIMIASISIYRISGIFIGILFYIFLSKFHALIDRLKTNV